MCDPGPLLHTIRRQTARLIKLFYTAMCRCALEAARQTESPYRGTELTSVNRLTIVEIEKKEFQRRRCFGLQNGAQFSLLLVHIVSSFGNYLAARIRDVRGYILFWKV